MLDENSSTEVKSEENINVQVCGTTKKLTFKVKKNTPLKKVMDAFCDRTDTDRNSVSFLNDEGVNIRDDHTPAALCMEEGAIIDVYARQSGGF